MIPKEVIAEIRAKARIFDIARECLSLEQSGVEYRSRCPLREHAETAPSFYINAQKNVFHCHGCKGGGDVITFVREVKKFSFKQTLEFLALRYNITLPDSNVELPLQQLYSLNETVCTRFQDALKGEAISYLRARGIKRSIAEAFRLGAATNLDGLPSTLLETLGLVRPRGLFFRNRIMCPVITPTQVVAGFSARTLLTDKAIPKYLNSPESPIFKKSEFLYGFHIAREHVHRRVILVEGNFDVLTLHQVGFPETIAPLGTTFTEEHASLLRHYDVRTVYVAFDTDPSGKRGITRILALLTDFDVRVVTDCTPDPDAFVRGKGDFQKALDRALSIVKYCRRALERITANDKRATFLNALPDTIRKEVLR